MAVVRGSPLDPAMLQMPGVERLRAVQRGDVPRMPHSHLTGWRITQVGPGTVTLAAPISPWLLNQLGFVDPTALISVALEAAMLSAAPASTRARVTNQSMAMYRVVLPDDGSLIARARVISTTRSFIFAEATLEDANGRLVGNALGSGITTDEAPSANRGFWSGTASSGPDPWELPLENVFDIGVGDRLSGLEAVQHMVSGEAGEAPIYRLHGSVPRAAEPGTFLLTSPAAPSQAAFDAYVAPAVIVSLAGLAIATAAFTYVPARYHLGLVNASATVLSPVQCDGGEMTYRATAVEHDNGFVGTNCECHSADGRLVATASSMACVTAPRDSATTGPTERKLLTVVFTDIVGSTDRANQMGDSQWSDLLDQHHRVVRQQLGLFSGSEVKTTGDGFLATFESPAQAIGFGRSLNDALTRIGLEITCGIHTGECEISDDDIAGIAVHTAARVMGQAAPGEVLVTGVVVDLAAGASFAFESHGTHDLKGIPRPQELYAVSP